MKVSRHASIKISGHHYDLFFIKPKSNANAHKYAKKLASMKNVAEVLVTEGECGFIVKARSGVAAAYKGEKAVILQRRSYKQMTSYLQYRR
jgi:hypothetical protein